MKYKDFYNDSDCVVDEISESFFLKENDAVRNAIKIYWSFVVAALRGQNPDGYYRHHKEEINFVADLLRQKYGPSSASPIYRGIILDPSEVHNGVVKGDPNITFVSFTEDKDIAVAFGDIKNDMAMFVMRMYPKKQGYIIVKETYDLNLLLFHHKWLNDANMWNVIRHVFGGGAKYTEMQKEVMLKPESNYTVEPVVPGSSNNLDVGHV